jgi:hypothetical protein
MEGLATHCMSGDKVEKWIDQTFKIAAVNFPKCIQYLGYKKISPLEEYIEATRPRSGKRSYDLAEATLYMVRYDFKYISDRPDEDDVSFSRYIYLPYVEKAGVLKLGATPYHVVPVMDSKVIAPTDNNVFVRLLKNKLNFDKVAYTVSINGVNKAVNIIHSNLYSNKGIKVAHGVAPTTRAMSAISHYVYGKYGYTTTFKMFCGYVPIVVETREEVKQYSDTTKYTVYGSSGIKPKSYIQNDWSMNEVSFVVENGKVNSQTLKLVESLLFGLIYIIDHFPTSFRSDYISYLDSTNLYRILLGAIIKSGDYDDSNLLNTVNEHYVGLDSYIDPVAKGKLKESGVNIDDFYELMCYILQHFTDLILESQSVAVNMYHKSLEILYNVVYEISYSINTLQFNLTKLVNRKDRVNFKDINDLFRTTLKTGKIFKFSSSILASELATCYNDHQYFNITSKISEQKATPEGAKSKNKHEIINETKHFDISMLEAGNLLYLFKNNPTPIARINPFTTLHESQNSITIVPSGNHKEVLERTKRALRVKANVNFDPTMLDEELDSDNDDADE